MNLEEKTVDGVLMLAIASPRLDNFVAQDFKSTIADRLVGEKPRVILDLSQVAFIDSSGLGALVSCLKMVGDPKRLVLCNVAAPVLSLFKLTRMDRVFNIYDSAQLALEALQE